MKNPETKTKAPAPADRTSYMHTKCGMVTQLSFEAAANYARDPKFYTGAGCAHCLGHHPASEFTWPDGTRVG